jgi:hypothetical protein
MKKYTVLPGQSLFDIAVIAYGHVSGVVWLIADNPALKGPTDRIYTDQQLLIREEIINNRARIYLQDFPVVATISKNEMPEGVGFWRLDEYVITQYQAENDVRFVPGTISYSGSPGARYIRFAITKTGSYTVVFKNASGVAVLTTTFSFIAGIVSQFGFITIPGFYTINFGDNAAGIMVP